LISPNQQHQSTEGLRDIGFSTTESDKLLTVLRSTNHIIDNEKFQT